MLKGNHSANIGWKMVAYHGEWSSGSGSAGGSGNGGDPRFWRNPQFLIKLVDVDLNDSDDSTTVIVALMQKYTREKKTSRNGQAAEEFIQFRLFRVISDLDAENLTKNGSSFEENQLEKVGNSGNYINKREVTAMFKLLPGYYVIIPSTFEPNCDGQFLVRVFTEQLIDNKNSVILQSNFSSTNEIADKCSQLKLNNSGRDAIRSLVGVLGQKVVEKSDKVKESFRNHPNKSHFGGNVFSRLLPDENDDYNIKKEYVIIKNKSKLHHVCSLM